jgi:thymidylate synthase
MNTADSTYLALLDRVMTSGKVRKDRTGVGTIAVFGHQMRFDLSEGFTLLTTKYVHHPAVIHELLWFLRGDTTIRYLVENGVRIWDDWPYDKYCKTPADEILPQAKNSDGTHFSREQFRHAVTHDKYFESRYGRVGRIYGAQMTSWKGGGDTPVNQIANLVNDLKTNPDSRRHIVTLWNPAELKDVALPPCHYSFQCDTEELSVVERVKVYANMLGRDYDDLRLEHDTDEEWTADCDEHNVPKRRLSLMFNTRSIDVFLGAPFDIASYSVMTHMLCQCVNMVPGELLLSSGNTHIYLNHVEQVKLQLGREPKPNLPRLVLNPRINDMFKFTYADFDVQGYEHHPAIKAPIAV